MTPERMAELCRAVLSDTAGAITNVTLITPKGQKMPPKFPRGQLLCEIERNGRKCHVRSYDAARVLAWLEMTGLINKETQHEHPDR